VQVLPEQIIYLSSNSTLIIVTPTGLTFTEYEIEDAKEIVDFSTHTSDEMDILLVLDRKGFIWDILDPGVKISLASRVPKIVHWTRIMLLNPADNQASEAEKVLKKELEFNIVDYPPQLSSRKNRNEDHNCSPTLLVQAYSPETTCVYSMLLSEDLEFVSGLVCLSPSESPVLSVKDITIPASKLYPPNNPRARSSLHPEKPHLGRVTPPIKKVRILLCMYALGYLQLLFIDRKGILTEGYTCGVSRSTKELHCVHSSISQMEQLEIFVGSSAGLYKMRLVY